MSYLKHVDDLDKSIAIIEQTLLDLKRQRNALVPMHRLPGELLVEIFQQLRRVAESSWSRVTRTCVYFRETAIQDPGLWSRVVFSEKQERWSTLCVQRSNGILLDITVNEDLFAPHAISHLSRAKSINVNISADRAQAMIHTPALSLQLANIVLRPFTAMDEFVTVDHLTFGGRCAHLTHLTLIGECNKLLLRDWPQMPSLRRLRISEVYVESDLEPFRQLTIRAPALQELDVGRLSIIKNKDGATEPPSTLRLSSSTLRALFIHHNAPSIVSKLLRALPEPTQVLCLDNDLETKLEEDPLDQRCIFDAYHTFLRRSGITQASTLTVVTYYSSAVQFGTAVHFKTSLPSHRDPIFTHCAPFLFMQGRLDTHHPLLALVQRLRLTSVEHASERWEDMDDTYGVQRMPEVRELVISEVREPLSPFIKHVKTWIRSRRGQLKRVVFQHCDNNAIQALADDLRRDEEGLKVVGA